ncbi:class I SAM-dependent methyltransferase [Aurantimonas sp. HBX-1]|uniref:class I SAM-dependent methyltransferase n=1 Tax=Aurantimonas sp. HBX-1 TaxID=2906072 RepID=UPI001F1CBCCD|nr:class I SAM-dependent methyltransferase [Aurantimonas sp. HBX-1]UIJ73451.1 class I SAM-dependent methyltransferase [Aurantimonas sp. HBX-1]
MNVSRQPDTTSLGPASVQSSGNDADRPHSTYDFARVYERTSNRVTGQIAATALDRIPNLHWGTRILDIAAGAGALSVPAALAGASVLAIDSVPGMVELLAERLAPFPGCEARQMDGQALSLDDKSFDATFSLLGLSLFPDWQRGLSEQARVTRTGGIVCVATLRKPPAGGPFLVMAEALRAVFPDMPPAATPEGLIALSDPTRLTEEFEKAGLAGVRVEEFDIVWEGPAGQTYLDELGELHRYMNVYTGLSKADQRRVDDAILSIVDRVRTGDRVVLRSPILLAVGTRQ